MMTKTSSTKKGAKGSSRQPVPSTTGGIQSHGGAQELIAPYENIAWCSRVSRQDYLYTQPEPFEYIYWTQVALRSLSRDTSPSNLQPKRSYPDADRYEDYKNDSLGFETLDQKPQYEMDIVDVHAEDPLVDLHLQFQPFQFTAIPVSADDNSSQAPPNLPTKMTGKNGVVQGKSHDGAAKEKDK